MENTLAPLIAETPDHVGRSCELPSGLTWTRCFLVQGGMEKGGTMTTAILVPCLLPFSMNDHKFSQPSSSGPTH